MTIFPNSIVVANEEAFSLIVPATDLEEAITFRVVPDDCEVESLRGLKLESATVTAHKTINGVKALRIMYRHVPNPNSSVKRLRGGL